MAEGFARAYARSGTVDARSGGTQPFGHVSPKAIRLMAEKGIDISPHRSKPLDLEFADRADAFVTLCGPLDEACPARLAQKAVGWDVEDPARADEDAQRRIRDEIEGRVIALLKDWRVLRPGLG